MVLPRFPRSGHCPIFVTSDVKVAISRLSTKRRWNFRKANWPKFTQLTELSSKLPDPGTSNINDAYSHFCSMLHQAAKHSIPRRRRNPYTPCWDTDCDELYKSYCDTNCDIERQVKGCQLLDLLGQKRRTRWEEEISNINFTHSCRKAWTTFNKLTGRSSPAKQCPVSANCISAVHVNNGKWKDHTPNEKEHTRAVNGEIKQLLQTIPPSSAMSQPFTYDEVTKAIKILKNGKAPGNDNIHTEILKNMAPAAVQWLQRFLSTCMTSSTIPSKWKIAKVIANLKPKKPANEPKSYRPISVLSHIYKLLERLLLSSISWLKTDLPL